MKLNIRYIIFSIILVALGACISKFEFEPQEQTFTVISGVITNSSGERTITVKQTLGLNVEGVPIEASGFIFKNGQKEAELVPLRTGELVVPLSFKVEEGATYHTEISANGKVYKSLPVQVPPLIRTDSLSYKLEERIKGFSNLGAPIKAWFVDVFAHFTVPENGRERRFYKWQVDESWSVLSNAAICYVIEPVTENPVTIADANDFVVGNVALQIVSRELEDSFLRKHYFNAYLHSIDRNLYEFYEKADRLTASPGTLFDEIPAPFEGNIFVADGKAETVLGVIEFSLVDTVRLLIDRSDFEQIIFDKCSSPFPCGGNGPCVCEDCRAVYGFSSTNKPFYWE